MMGLVLIIIGATFLLKNLGYISQDAWDIIWPAILVLAGLWILIRGRFQGSFWMEKFWRE